MLRSFSTVVILALLFASCNTSKVIFQERSNDWKEFGEADWRYSNDELFGEIKDGAGFVMTKRKYSNFQLELEFIPDSTINSGVFIRCKNEDITPVDCYEINIWDLHPNQESRTGAIVTREVPLAHVETICKWNSYKIHAMNKHIKVWVNDILTADFEDDTLSDGYIGLQAKGIGRVGFRNVKIKEL